MFTITKKHIKTIGKQTIIALLLLFFGIVKYSLASEGPLYAQTPQKAEINLTLPVSTDYRIENQQNTLSLSFSKPIAEQLNLAKEKLDLYIQDQKISKDKNKIDITIKFPYLLKTKYKDGILKIEIRRTEENKQKTNGKNITVELQPKKDVERLVFSYQSKPKFSVIANQNSTTISFLQPLTFNWDKLKNTPFYSTIEQSTNKLGGIDIFVPQKLVKSIEKNQQIILTFPQDKENQNDVAMLKSNNRINKQETIANTHNDNTTLSTPNKVVSMAFPWNMEVGASIFKRGEYIWIAFDHTRSLDLDELRNQSRDVVEQIIQLPHSKATILRVTPKQNVKVGLRQEGFLWIVDFYTHNVDYKIKELPIYVQYNSMKQSYLYIPTDSGGNSLSIIDPEIGDVILIGTETNLGFAIDENYNYPDLEILPAKQGFAIIPNTSDIVLTKGNTGFSISGSNRGLNISDNIENLKRQQQMLVETSDVFDLKIPAQLLKLDFNTAEKQLKESINKSAPEQKSKAKLLLIKYYLGMGLGTEALRTIKQLTETDKQQISPETIAALTGIADFLLYRYDEALDNFSYQGLQNNNEAIFWRTLTDSAINFKKENDIVLLTFISVIRDYPQELKERIALVAADTAIKSYNDISTQNFMDILKNSQDNDARRAHILYLNAQKFEYQGYHNNAIQEYGYATMHKSQKYAALARFARINLELKLNLIKPSRAIPELERLRFAWGENSFKYTLLQKLAEVYILDKNYNKAMQTYYESLSFAQTPTQKEDVLNKMLALFEDLYMNGRADEMQAVKAIALYKDYEWLAPRSQYYTNMVQKLADRMVAVDLLTSAKDILDAQLRLVVLNPEQKAQIGVRLALIYLFEQDSVAALDILKKTDAPNLSETQQNFRKIIMARALSNLKRNEEALDLLKDDYSKNALLLKTDIYWKSSQWDKAADTIKYLIEKPQKGKALSSEQISYILDWITALKKANRNTVIFRIRNTFLPYFEKTSYFSTFNVLTNNLEVNRVDMNAIDKAVSDISAYSNFSKIYDESLLQAMPEQPENN